MPLQNDENQALKPKDLLFVLAIAGRIDAQSRLLAQDFETGRHVYYGYAVLDSLSSSYSMFKYFFDVFVSNNDPDLMHEMMMTPGGIIAIVAESLFLVAFSLFACRYENADSESIEKFISSAWPYLRGVMKGLKNAYKGWRSAVQAISVIGGVDLKYAIIPVGLTLGIFAAANRFWSLREVENRKLMMKQNAALLLEIMKGESLTNEQLQKKLSEIAYQSDESRHRLFFSVAAGGLIDGLYLYVGVLSLSVVTPPVFIAMAIMCSIYTLACVVTRLYEEYDYQLRLLITQTNCKLALITNELETRYMRLLVLNNKPNQTQIELDEIKSLKNSVADLIGRFDEMRCLLRAQTSRSYLSASLLGIKNGLFAYSALASILFLIAAILILTSTAFPPALLVFSVSLGMVFMLGFLAHSLVINYFHLNNNPGADERPYDQLIQMRIRLQDEPDNAFLLKANEFRCTLKDGLTLDPSPQFFFPEWFEVIRSFFSGVSKGQKFVDFAGNPLQEADAQGHYHDTPVMYILAVFSSILFAVILAFRALARGLGRAPLAKVDLAGQIKDEPPQESSQKENNDGAERVERIIDKIISGSEVIEQKAPPIEKPIQVIRPRSVSAPSSTNTKYSFFRRSVDDQPKPKLPHSTSEDSIVSFTKNTPPISTVRGLE